MKFVMYCFVIDSWGKFPSGLLRGNLYDLGDFDQCLSIKAPNSFEPRYCLARLSKDELEMPKSMSAHDVHGIKAMSHIFGGFNDRRPDPRIVPSAKNTLGLNIGICIPKSCSPEMVTKLLTIVQKKLLRNKAILSLVPETCQVKEDLGWNLDRRDYICLALIGTIFIIMILSTFYDVIRTKQDRDKMQILIAFSVYTNGKKMFACKRSKSEYSMECLNGIRVFSALWVIYAHAAVMTMMAPVFNFAYIPEWAKEYPTIVILLAPFSVDTFLFLSGLLVTWSLLKHLTKTNGKINVLKLYVHRYLRLTPILAVIVFISASIYKKLGSGPLWFSFILHAINCDEYWWSALLYIQNYYNADAICLSHTWYLSVDMQLFLAAPLFGYLLYRFGKFFVPVIGLLVAVCFGWTYWLFTHFELVNQILNMKSDTQLTFTLTYFPTHPRMAPWLIGVWFAYYLFKIHGRREKWSTIRVVLHWTVTAAIFSVITYYTYNLQQMDHVASPTESGIYTGGTRISWSVFLCLVIYACVKGYGGPVNWFLSLPLWQPLARLTYAIYLIHLPAMLLTAAATRRPVLLTGRYILLKCFGDFLAAILLGTLASLAFESPVVVLEEMLFGSKKNQQNESGIGAARTPSPDSVENRSD